MFFRRLFTIWFLLFTLASSAAWAMDDHTEEHHGQAAFAADGDQDKHPWSQDDCADHCCHASAHAMGLISFTTDIAALPLSDNYFVSEHTPHSLILSPPFHPPIA